MEILIHKAIVNGESTNVVCLSGEKGHPNVKILTTKTYPLAEGLSKVGKLRKVLCSPRFMDWHDSLPDDFVISQQ